MIYPAVKLSDTNLCLILYGKSSCNIIKWNDKFHPGRSFDLVIQNPNNKLSIEVTGFIKVHQKDTTFDPMDIIVIMIGSFIGVAYGPIIIICIIGAIYYFCCNHCKTTHQYSSINEV